MGFEELKFVVEIFELKGCSGAKTGALRCCDIGIV
jgi:hypothetical protein